MTDKELLQLAEEAGFVTFLESTEVLRAPNGAIVQLSQLTRFAELVAQSERNLYAEAVERLRKVPFIEVPASADTEVNEIVILFDAIRNRSNEEPK